MLMTNEAEPSSTFKQIKGVFAGDDQLPTHFVNMVNARAGLEEFFLTFGTVLPLDLAENQSLEDIDSFNIQPLFRCAMSRSVMKQVIDLISNIADQMKCSDKTFKLLLQGRLTKEDYLEELLQRGHISQEEFNSLKFGV
jgi:hypothetical protein